MTTIVTTGAIVLVFAFCLSTSLVIAFVFLKMVVNLTTRASQNGPSPAASISRRWLAAHWLRSSQDLGR